MLVSGRLFLYLILIWCWSLLLNTKGDILNTKERRKRHTFPLLGYLHGYKIGQNFALQLPPFVVSPLIIVPVNQQSINIQKSGTDESFHENVGTFQSNFPVKQILNSSVEDIETNIKLTKKNCTSQDNVSETNDRFREINVATANPAEIVSKTDEFVSTTDSIDTNETEHFTTMLTDTTKVLNGFYPLPVYNNDKIISLHITTPLAEDTLADTGQIDKAQMVTSETNNTEIETSESENIENKRLESGSSKVVSFQLTTEKYYARPNTRYYNPHSFWQNAMVDQSSITTNSYREEQKELPLPPQYDDRWRRFSSLSKVVLPASGFKPLAGLYYDGFLHKSLTKKTGFIPFDKHDYE